jgi:hypothetical protein
MIDRRKNGNQFDGVNALQKDIERLTKERDSMARERENAQTKLLEEHGEALAELKISVALVVDRTKDLPTVIQGINDRVSKLEKWKTFVAGIAFSFTSIGTILGWGLSFLFKSR